MIEKKEPRFAMKVHTLLDTSCAEQSPELVEGRSRGGNKIAYYNNERPFIV